MSELNYQVIHTRRRTISIIIRRDGSLVVRAPKKTQPEFLKRLIEKKQGWIKRHLDKIKARQVCAKTYCEGETFLFLGLEHTLHLSDKYRKLKFEDDIFYLPQNKIPHGRQLFAAWYKQQAEKIIVERAHHYARLMNLDFHRLKITSAQTRWGSCSSKGSINFSWRLILAPLDIVDSVIVHELAHLVHHNHSKRFWSFVHQFYPNYKPARKWLNTNGHKLHI